MIGQTLAHYSVEEADGVHFITMEMVRGKTLSELLPGKGFSLAKFLELAIPLADAVIASPAIVKAKICLRGESHLYAVGIEGE